MAARRQFRNGPSQAVRIAAAHSELELENEPVGVELSAAHALNADRVARPADASPSVSSPSMTCIASCRLSGSSAGNPAATGE